MGLNLDDIDVDGAVREAADKVSGDTRLDFLRKGALTGGAALSGGAILSALVPGIASASTGRSIAHAGEPPASFGSGAQAILNYALTLEYLEAAFYNQASRNHIARGDKQLTAFLETTVRDENYHVGLLQGALKGAGLAAVKSPRFDFGKAVTDKSTFASTAYVLENTGVHAYLGQAANLIGDPAYLIVAARIVTIEARHSGAIGLYLGKPIAPSGPLDYGQSADKVISEVNATKFVTQLYSV